MVDDDDGIRRGLKALLTLHEFDVLTFGSAESFLAALPPDLTGCLLLDVRMPGMSGLELQREIRRRSVALPVIIITGHGDVPMAVAALKAGPVNFIEKPFDSDAILTAVNEALRVPRVAASLTALDRQALQARAATLSAREKEVMDLVVAGSANKTVSQHLKIALRTVEIHRARVMEKMGARSLSELVRMAIRLEG
ncbi:MAG TPA: response regulator [Alphaproteobacteria bacterium]